MTGTLTARTPSPTHQATAAWAATDPTAIPSRDPTGPTDRARASQRPPTPGPRPDRRACVRQLMGMPISIHIRGRAPRDPRVEPYIEAAFAELTWVDETFSRWRADSHLSRIRRGELSVEEAAPEVAEVFELCQEAQRRTRGAFCWCWPDPQTGELIPEPTGLVKGWAIERAARRLDPLAQLGEGYAYCLNAGGDIAVGGDDSAGGPLRPWRLGIEDPHAPGRIVRIVELTRGGLATSGTAARGAHLLDPATGEPVPWEGSVSVWGPSVMWADVWATALFVGPLWLEADLYAEDDAEAPHPRRTVAHLSSDAEPQPVVPSARPARTWSVARY